MNILVCIDDTDNIESKGTGELASQLSAIVCDQAWGSTRPVTRHQLLMHPDIPYTSHNSSMCFAAEIRPEFLDLFTEYAQAFLMRESAPGSDPGLCIVNCDRLANSDALIAFGRRAKTAILSKEEAYGLAGRLNVHLSEHGGTGLGVVGALAGCGLRLTGNDGRFRGHFRVTAANSQLCVAELMRQTGVDVVKSLDGMLLHHDEVVHIGEKVKAVLQNGKSTLLVFADPGENNGGGHWRTCTRQQLKVF